MRFTLLTLVVLVVAWTTTVVQAYPSENISVTWSDVPSTTPQPRNLDSPNLGECVCDVTRGLCDVNCCCDSDCSTAAVALFEYCLPETYSTPDIEYCYAPNAATTIKRINNIKAVALDKQKQAQEAICVIRVNHPSSLYRYFTVPTSVAKQPDELLRNDWPVQNQSRYDVGGPLPLVRYVQSGDSAAFRAAGMFTLPTMTSYGGCSNEGVNVGFMDPIQGITCALNGAQICDSFPLSRFENIFLSALNSSGPASGYTPINVRLESLAGTVLESVDPSILPTNTSYVSTNDGTYCRNALMSMKAVFHYNATNTTHAISSANIAIEIADVPLATFVPLTFQSTFVQVDQTDPSVVISATPGYVIGDRVRAGALTTNGSLSAITEQASGFALPSGSRSCLFNVQRPVGFMNSVLNSGCSLSVTEAQMEEMCTSGSTDHVLSLLQVNGGTDHVAMTNDALANDTTSWIPIQGMSTLAAVPGTFDAVERQCDSVLSGLHFQFVVARAGVEYNPQDIIVGAFASPIYLPWRINNSTDYSAAASSLQQLVFKTTFTRYNPNSQATRRSRVKAPPILPRLDDSIFYPFRKPYPL